MKLIPHSRPWLTEADTSAVMATLQSEMIAQGEQTRAFEDALSLWVGIEDGGVAVGRGAAALVLALLALRVGVGDEVVMPTYVCSSVFEAVLSTGATPVLCDVGCSWVVTAENVERYLTGRTKVLLVPHMYGIFAHVDSFRQFGIPIIEDCAQAIADKGQRQVAGDIGVFSFHPTKCLTTGEGGMAVSAKKDLVSAMRVIRDGSQNSDKARFFSPLSDIAAALGLSQLARYSQALHRRLTLALKYKAALEQVLGDSFGDEAVAAYAQSMFFRFPISVPGGLDAYQESFAQRHIIIRRGVDRLLHRCTGLPDQKFEMGVKLFNTTVSLPIYPALTCEEQAYCIETAVEIFSKQGQVSFK
ncbi:MAG: DegT/DnrJ/EryC1/StrS aminotransferase family protein [Pseudomonadota bacterium]